MSATPMLINTEHGNNKITMPISNTPPNTPITASSVASTESHSGSSVQQTVDSWEQRLLPFAPNMLTLLTVLKDREFKCAQLPESQMHENERSSQSERNGSLATLMQLLTDQADHDGFRLITINTEPKRVIMACNRQGKPPARPSSSEEDETAAMAVDSQQRQSVDSVTVASIGASEVPSPTESSLSVQSGASNGSRRSKSSSRSGTSVRCGCRMRVNMNYHSKLNAWRVTSFENEHNHEYGSGADNYLDSNYQVTDAQIELAIKRFKSRTVNRVNPMISPAQSDSDAAAVLSTLAIVGATSKATSKQQQQQQHHNGVLTAANKPLSPVPESPKAAGKMIIPSSPSSKPPQPPISIDVGVANNSHFILPPPSPSLMTTTTSTAAQGGGRYFVVRRRRSQTIESSQPMTSITATTEHLRAPISASALPSPGGSRPRSLTQVDQMKQMASTAVEVDRYAMLTSAYKKLVAIACRKREWTEEVIGNVGRIFEKIQANGGTQLMSAGIQQTTGGSPGQLASARPPFTAGALLSPSTNGDHRMFLDDPFMKRRRLNIKTSTSPGGEPANINNASAELKLPPLKTPTAEGPNDNLLTPTTPTSKMDMDVDKMRNENENGRSARPESVA